MIELRQVRFCYPDSDRGVGPVDLRIERGERLALMGPSGCGKSTLLKLLLGFYEPDEGEILWDGAVLRGTELRGRTAYVPQDATIFSASLYENIHWARPSASREEVLMAARRAHIHDFIEGLPEGYETEVSGQTLSGGQRQRIAIARAILRDAPLVLLDEITSALDPEVSRSILEELPQTFAGKTMLFVTHDARAAAYMDRVYNLSPRFGCHRLQESRR